MVLNLERISVGVFIAVLRSETRKCKRPDLCWVGAGVSWVSPVF